MKQPFGSVHGRFQPFHKGHLEYVIGALDHCNHVYIGITQNNIESLKWTALDVARHRSDPTSNPFTYGERFRIIERALTNEGIDSSRFSIVPFPIESPSELEQYVPKSITIFTTIYDDWNRSKIDLLRSLGYNVEVLWERSVKDYEGKRIRALMADGDNRWKQMVPAGAVDTIEQLYKMKQHSSLVDEI